MDFEFTDDNHSCITHIQQNDHFSTFENAKSKFTLDAHATKIL